MQGQDPTVAMLDQLLRVGLNEVLLTSIHVAFYGAVAFAITRWAIGQRKR